MGYDEATQQAVVTDIPLRGKRLFIREDCNVPLDKQGHITDDTGIKAALPSIRYAIAGGAKVILASHLGQPVGKPDSRYSLRPVAKRLSELLGQEVMMAEDCIGPAVEALVAEIRKGNVLLLENRFHIGEEPNDPCFAQHLAPLADIYVNDAFGTAHRAHGSTEGITKFISAAVAGLLMEAELNHLGELLATPLYRHLGRGEGVGQDRPDLAPAVQAGSGADRRRGRHGGRRKPGGGGPERITHISTEGSPQIGSAERGKDLCIGRPLDGDDHLDALQAHQATFPNQRGN